MVSEETRNRWIRERELRSIRGTVWYHRYLELAKLLRLGGCRYDVVVKAMIQIDRDINETRGYGSDTTARSARRAIGVVCDDLGIKIDFPIE